MDWIERERWCESQNMKLHAFDYIFGSLFLFAGVFARLFGLYVSAAVASPALHNCISTYNRSGAAKIRAARLEYTVRIQSGRFRSQRAVHSESPRRNRSEEGSLLANAVLHARRSDVRWTCHRRLWQTLAGYIHRRVVQWDIAIAEFWVPQRIPRANVTQFTYVHRLHK